MPAPSKNAWLGGVAVVTLGAAVILYFARSGGSAEIPNIYTYKGVCLACKNETESKYKAGEAEPFVCGKCNQRAVYGWWYCMKCKKRFVPELMRGSNPPRVPAMPPCFACGSPSTGAWVPEDPTQDSKGTAPLPKWP